jgi:hypothetical protein
MLGKMTNLINKLLGIFNLKLVFTKPDTRLVKESVKFLDQHKDYWNDDVFFPPYVGDINYVQERVKGEFPQVSGKTYICQMVLGTEDKYYDYDGDTFTAEQLQEKLK